MAFVKTKYGVEYNPRSSGGVESSGFGWLVTILCLFAVISLLYACFTRMMSETKKQQLPSLDEKKTSAIVAEKKKKPSIPRLAPIKGAIPQERSVVVRNLLMRLKEAERLNDIEMATSTIEKIRSLPGQPAADLDDQLARRLGVFNFKRLFELHNPQWVGNVKVKPGDSAIRIARENGSTFASLLKLNSLTDANHIKVGQTLKVLANPRFILVVRKRSRIADLSLNGRFFKRYDLIGEVVSSVGVDKLGPQTRQYFAEKGIVFSPEERRELEMLLPANSQVSISEM